MLKGDAYKGEQWPVYVHENKSWVLVPEVGDLAQPMAHGWSLTEYANLVHANGGDPPRYCGVPAAWCDGVHQMDPCGGKWYVNDFSGLGHSAKDAVQCKPFR